MGVGLPVTIHAAIILPSLLLEHPNLAVPSLANDLGAHLGAVDHRGADSGRAVACNEKDSRQLDRRTDLTFEFFDLNQVAFAYSVLLSTRFDNRIHVYICPIETRPSRVTRHRRSTERSQGRALIPTRPLARTSSLCIGSDRPFAMASQVRTWHTRGMRTAPTLSACGLLLLSVACETQKQPAETSKAAAPQAAPPGESTASQPPGASQPAAEGGAPISGTVGLADGLGPDAIQKSDVLYIMARASQGGGLAGPLVAVKKLSGLTAEGFPARFEVSQGNTMMQGVPFKGPFIVYARLDRDGDPMTKTADDLYATIPEPVDNGTTDLKLTLKKGEPKTAPAAPGGGAPKVEPTSRPASP